MNVPLHVEQIKELYQTGSSDDQAWAKVLGDFKKALDAETDPLVLENCILADKNWDLSVSERLELLERAKSLGAASLPFLKDYYGYKGAHLDPGPEKDDAILQLKRLLEGSDSELNDDGSHNLA